MEPTSISPKRNLPRDLFLHLLAMFTLYWSAISFVTMLWQYINYFFPDALHYSVGLSGPLRFAVSSLIIVFPVFIITSFFLNRIYRKEYVVRESKIRKWLIYLTLFIASLIIIGDLVAVINAYLSGEITARFILKAFSILFVAAVVFSYYLDDVRKEQPTNLAKPFAYGTSLLVVVSIIGSFFIIGSPKLARDIQFDQQRVNDLSSIQFQTVSYWQRKQSLPTALSDLNDPFTGFSVPADPATNQQYEYTIKDPIALTFDLCATFATDSKAIPESRTLPKAPVPYSASDANWNHATGRVCFERTIDKQLYPPLQAK